MQHSQRSLQEICASSVTLEVLRNSGKLSEINIILVSKNFSGQGSSSHDFYIDILNFLLKVNGYQQPVSDHVH
jgi:hypothetical protein